jgi:SEC-C motif-containing protein
MMHSQKNCPCGSKITYLQCCGAFIEQGALPKTAEALMRSRYSAYSQAKIKYIQQTMLGQALQDFNFADAKHFAEQADWQDLTVVATQLGQIGDTIGYVEFVARYKMVDKQAQIHELSEFHKIDNRWYYMAGKAGKIRPGRNEPCWCGSGKKYKKCCERQII